MKELTKEQKARLAAFRKADREPPKPISPLFAQIGKSLKEKRKARNLTLHGLMELSGVDHAHIHRIESGVQKVEVAVLERLATALGCRLSIEMIRCKETAEKAN